MYSILVGYDAKMISFWLYLKIGRNEHLNSCSIVHMFNCSNDDDSASSIIKCLTVLSIFMFLCLCQQFTIQTPSLLLLSAVLVCFCLCCFLAVYNIDNTHKTYRRGRFTFDDMYWVSAWPLVVQLHSHP